MQSAGDRIDIYFKSNDDRTNSFYRLTTKGNVWVYFKRKKKKTKSSNRKKNGIDIKSRCIFICFLPQMQPIRKCLHLHQKKEDA